MIHLNKKARLLSTCMAAILWLLCSSSTPVKIETYYFNYENILGTSFELKVSALSEDIAAKAEDAALSEIERLSSILSTYNPESEISRWQKTMNSDVHISRELFEVLTLFDQWKLKTNGALNASAAVATTLWKKAMASGEVPGDRELINTVASMSKSHWELQTGSLTAKHLSIDPLVLNSFVKSYILNKAQQKVMSTLGVSTSVLNVGGDIVVSGQDVEQVQVSNPKADAENDRPISIINLHNKAIATSGNYRRGFQICDKWFSHILDARTAIPVTEIISATVVTDNAADAGAMATAFNILSPEESAKLADEIPGTEFLIITKDGKHIKSDGWEKPGGIIESFGR